MIEILFDITDEQSYEQYEYKVNSTTGTISALVLCSSIFATTIGLCIRNAKMNYFDTHTLFGLCTSILLSICVHMLTFYNLEVDTSASTHLIDSGLLLFEVFFVIWLLLTFHLWYKKDYISFWLYSYICSKNMTQKIVYFDNDNYNSNLNQKYTIVDLVDVDCHPHFTHDYLFGGKLADYISLKYINLDHIKERYEQLLRLRLGDNDKVGIDNHTPIDDDNFNINVNFNPSNLYVFWKIESNCKKQCGQCRQCNECSPPASFWLQLNLILIPLIFLIVYVVGLWWRSFVICVSIMALFVSRLAMVSAIICAIFFLIIFRLIIYMFYYSNNEYDDDDPLFDAVTDDSYVFPQVTAWGGICLLSLIYISSLKVSTKRSKNIAFLLIMSEIASALDLLTDIAVIFVWIKTEAYYWAGLQIIIVIVSQWIELYFIIIIHDDGSSFTLLPFGKNAENVMDLIFILFGLGKLWLGMKKLMNIHGGSYYRRNQHDINFQLIKIWELLFESFPTLFLSSYILSLHANIINSQIILSMTLSFCNISMTVTTLASRALIRKDKKKKNKKHIHENHMHNQNHKLKQNFHLIIDKLAIDEKSNNEEIEMHDLNTGMQNDHLVTNSTIYTDSSNKKSRKIQKWCSIYEYNYDAVYLDPKIRLSHQNKGKKVPGLSISDDNGDDSSYIYLTDENSDEHEDENENENSDVNLHSCCRRLNDFIDLYIYHLPDWQLLFRQCYYDFMIWSFSITDSFVRVIPMVMLISFIHSQYFVTSSSNDIDDDDNYNYNSDVNNSWDTFIVFGIHSVLYLIIFGYELYILTKGFIIERDENHGSLIMDIIYSFYSVISSGLYILVLIDLPELKYKINHSLNFFAYQMVRICFSIVILLILTILQLISWSDYYTWAYLTCLIVFVLHLASFYHFVTNVCLLGFSYT